MPRTEFKMMDPKDCKSIPIIDKTTYNKGLQEKESRPNIPGNKEEEELKEENIKTSEDGVSFNRTEKKHSKDPHEGYKILDRMSFRPIWEDEENYQEYGRNPIFFLKNIFNGISQRVLPYYEEKLYKARRTKNYHKLKLNMFRPMVKGLERMQISWQELEMLHHYKMALQKIGPNTLVFCSGNGIGKTRISAFIMFHFVTCYYRSKVIYIAPRNDMALETKELVKSLFNICHKYGFRLKEKRNTLYFGTDNTGISSIKFVSSKVGFQGIHAENFLVVADEAADLSDDILRSVNWLQGRGNNIFIMLGNPRYDKGFFHDICCLNSEHVTVLHFDAEQSPLIEREYIQKAKDLYGERSDEYIRRIKGWYPRKKDSSN